MTDQQTCLEVLCAAFFVAAPGAQTQQTAPTGFATTAGHAGMSPTWRSGERMQILYDAGALQGASSTTIAELAFRADELIGNVAARDYRITVRMSSAGVPSPEHADTANLPANYGQDLRVVFLPRVVTFPITTPVAGGGPSTDYVVLALDVPFRYTSGSHLLVEIDWELAGTIGGPHVWYMDVAEFPNTGWGVTSSPFGQACSDPTGAWHASSYFSGVDDTLSLRHESLDTPGLPAVILVGDDDRQAGTLPLPLV
jgi:hypothetical protein